MSKVTHTGCVVKQAVPFCGGHRIHNADEHDAIARSAISVNFSLLTGHVREREILQAFASHLVMLDTLAYASIA